MKTLALFGTLSLSLLAAALVPTPPGISLTYSGCHLTPHGLLVLGVCLSNDTSHAVEYQAWGGGKPVMLRLRRTSTDDVLADCVPIDGIQRWIELPRGRNVTFDVLVNHLIDVDELYADVSVKVDGVMVSVRSTSVPVGDVRGIVDRAGMRGRSQQFMKAAMGDWTASNTWQASRQDPMSPLHAAAAFGRLDLVKILCHKTPTAQINARAEGSGVTPLMVAVANGHEEVGSSLVAAGADVGLTVGADSEPAVARYAKDLDRSGNPRMLEWLSELEQDDE